MPEATRTPLGLVQALHDIPDRLNDRGHHELRDAVASLDREGLLTMVDEEYYQLPTVVGVYRPRTIDHRDTCFSRQTGAWAYLGFVVRGKGDGNAGWDRSALAWSEEHGLGDSGPQIHPCGLGRFVGREREIVIAR